VVKRAGKLERGKKRNPKKKQKLLTQLGKVRGTGRKDGDFERKLVRKGSRTGRGETNAERTWGIRLENPLMEKDGDKTGWGGS